MPNPPINLTIRIPRPLGTELPDLPLDAVFVVKEFDELVERVAVCTLRVGAAGTGGRYEEGCDVAEVEAGFWVSGARACDDLAEEGGHCGWCWGYWEGSLDGGILELWCC